MANRKGASRPTKSRSVEAVRQQPLSRAAQAGPLASDDIPSSFFTPSRIALLAAITIVLAALLAYQNSFAGVFLFDDENWIQDNPTIRQFWPIWPWLFPKEAKTLGGRPVISLTLAINYALGETNVWGYHAVNLAIHILAGLTLFGIVRRTLMLPGLRDRFGTAAAPLAWAVGLLWTVHPLQTQAVTYIIQRCESLVSLFYLLTLYCVIRGTASTRPRLWSLAAVATCVLGMGTKEVMATAPLVVLLYDRTFLSGSFRNALRARYGLYLGLAASWAVILGLVMATGFYGGTTGFAVKKFTWWSYLLTQAGVLVHYLRLAFWPTGLCLDYGWPPARSLAEIVPPLLLIAGLLALTGWALVKRPALGFLGAWFFLILAPTSSIMPLDDAAFDHRMYLSLAAVATAVVIGGYLAARWLVDHNWLSLRAAHVLGGSLVAILAVVLGVLAFQRNALYENALLIWQDAVEKAPRCARAQNNLGLALFDRGQADEAIARYEKALAIEPDYVLALYNLGHAFALQSQFDRAITEFETVLKNDPNHLQAHYNLATVLDNSGRYDEAIVQYQKAMDLQSKDDPAYVQAERHLAAALARCGRTEAAVAHYQKAIELNPDYPGAHHNLGSLFATLWRFNQAVAEYREALRLKPDFLEAYNNLAMLLASCPDPSVRNGDKAVTLAQHAVSLSGGREPVVLDTLAAAYAEASRFPEAVQTAQKALDLATEQKKPALAEAIQAKLRLYEAGKPFRQVQQPQQGDR